MNLMRMKLVYEKPLLGIYKRKILARIRRHKINSVPLICFTEVLTPKIVTKITLRKWIKGVI